MNWTEWLTENQGERMDAFMPINPRERRTVHISRYGQAATWASNLPDVKTIYDFPCGTGYGSSILAFCGFDVCGFDRDPKAIEYAREFYGKNESIHFDVDDLVRPKIIDGGECDCIVCLEGIEHVPTPDIVLKNFADISKRLIISFPHNQGTGVYHLYNTTLHNMQGMLHDAGYDVLQAACQGADSIWREITELNKIDNPCIMLYSELN